jgi:predicted esterase
MRLATSGRRRRNARGLLGPFSLRGLQYCVRLPTNAAAQAPHPVLCFLHGLGEASAAYPDIRDAARVHGPLNAKASRAAGQFITVFPQLPRTGGNVWPKKAAAVRAIVKRVQRDYRGDSRRTYLSGFSYGANGTLRIGSGRSRMWAALWPVDPPHTHQRPARMPIWLWYGTKSRYLSSNQENENTLGLERASQTRVPDETRVITGLEKTHPGMGSAPYRRSAPYEWLLRHQRPFGSAINRASIQRAKRMTSPSRSRRASAAQTAKHRDVQNAVCSVMWSVR